MAVRFFLLSLLACFSYHIQAQNYPISAAVALNPPLSNLLTQFSSEPEKIQLTLLNKDFATPVVDAFIRIRIDGPGITLESPATYKPSAPVTLTAGSPSVLNGMDLADLFLADNLSFAGISKSAFQSAGSKLPEGFYKFTFTVYDWHQGLRISNEGFATASLFKHQPPIINSPADGSEIALQTPQYLLIQFTPRHTASPALAGKIRYKIRMVEVIPSTRNANDVLQSSAQPFFEYYTDQTSFIYGPGESPLVDGRTYGLQVQAVDVDGSDIFDNNGYSQVITFVYGSRCPVPLNFQALKSDGASLQLSWDAATQHRGYMVYYRQAGKSSTNSEMVFSTGFNLNSLKPGTIYELQVSGICRESESGKSPVIRITTDTLKSAFEKWAATACGKPLPTVNLSNKNPLAILQAGDKIYAADFEITVVAAKGGAGKFSGTGLVELPYTGKIPIPCTFENITLNTDRRMLDGKIQILRKPLELSNRSLSNIAQTWRQVFGDNWNRFSNQNYDGLIKDVSTDKDGNIVIDGSNGKQSMPKGKNTEITDEKGNTWYVSEGGNISKAEGPKEKPPVVEDIKTGEGTPAALRSGMAKVFFSTEAEKGYDAVEISQLTAGNKYDQLDCADTTYYAGWKLLKAGKSDTINAEFAQGNLFKFNLDSVRFLRSDGTILPFTRSGNTYQIIVTGRMNLYADAIWAVANIKLPNAAKANREILGKINLINVDPRKMNVVLVPVNGIGYGTDAFTAQTALNRIYTAYGVQANVTVGKSLTVNSYDAAKDKIAVDRSQLTANYNSDLYQFISSLETRQPWVGNYNGSDTAWMFMLGSSTDATDGYMGLNRNYGFLFLEGASSPKIHTLAHELSHGLLNLEHSFGTDASSAGKSQNLMDYSAPYGLLNYSQWMAIFDPEIRTRILQKSGEGKIRTLLSLNCAFPQPALDKLKKYNYFQVSDVNWIQLPKKAVPIEFAVYFDGVVCLKSFKLDDVVYEDPGILIEKKKTVHNPYEMEFMGYDVDHFQKIKTVDIVKYSNRKDLIILHYGTDSKGCYLKIEKDKFTLNSTCCISDSKELNGVTKCTDYILIQKIHTAALSDYTPENVFNIFKDGYQYCAMAEIPIADRIFTIDALIQNNDYWVVKNKNKLDPRDSNLINDLISSTPVYDRVQLLNKGFKKSGYLWLRRLWKGANTVGNGVDYEDVEEVLNTLSLFVANYYSELEIEENKTKTDNINDADNLGSYTYLSGMNEFEIGLQNGVKQYAGKDKLISFTNSMTTKISQYDDGYIRFQQDYILTDGTLAYDNPDRPKQRQFIVNYDETFSPFELINIDIAHNYPELGLDAGTTMVLPAFMAMVMERNIERKLSARNWHKFWNAIAIASAVTTAPVTAGVSLEALSVFSTYVSGVTSGFDLAIQNEKNNLTVAQYNANAEFYNYWESFVASVNITSMGAGTINIAVKTLPKIGSKLNMVANWNRFTGFCKTNAARMPDAVKKAWLGMRAAASFEFKYSTAIDLLVKEISQIQLPPNIKQTFGGAFYRTVETNSKIKLFRSFGAPNGYLKGGYATTKANASREELAILDEWGNSLRFEAELEVPQGETLNIGRVAEQTSSDGKQHLTGDADQILLPQNWDYENWVIAIVDRKTNIKYTYLDFQKAFPDIIKK